MYNAHLFVYALYLEGTGCGYLSVMFKEFIVLWTEDPNTWLCVKPCLEIVNVSFKKHYHLAFWVKFSAGDVLNSFLVFPPENRFWRFMQIVSIVKSCFLG